MNLDTLFFDALSFIMETTSEAQHPLRKYSRSKYSRSKYSRIRVHRVWMEIICNIVLENARQCLLRVAEDTGYDRRWLLSTYLPTRNAMINELRCLLRQRYSASSSESSEASDAS